MKGTPTHLSNLRRRSFVVLVLALSTILLAPVVSLAALMPRSTPEVARIATDADAAFAQGMDLAGDASSRRNAFRTAADGYAALRAIVDTPATNLNLGNARFRAGDAPGAIAAYRRALLLSPQYMAAQQNLNEAVRALEKLPQPPAPTLLDSFREYTTLIPTSIRVTLGLTLWSVGCGIFVWRLHRAVQRALEDSTAHATAHLLAHAEANPSVHSASSARASLMLSVCALGLAAMLITSLALDQLVVRWSNRAVLTNAAVARQGNGAGFEPAYAEPLPAGAECRILEERPGWTFVSFGDGTSAWLPASSLTRITIAANSSS